MQATRLLARRHIVIKELLFVLCFGLADLVQDIANLLPQGAIALGFGIVTLGASHLIAHLLVHIETLLAIFGG